MINFTEELKKIGQLNNLRSLNDYLPIDPTHGWMNGKKVTNFSSNDYLGFTFHPAVKKAAAESIETYGTGAGASRLVTGNIGFYRELEELIAELKGSEAALVFSSGYQANIGILSALLDRKDLVLADKLCHASLIDGCRLSGAEFKRYPHLDLELLEKALKQSAGFKNRFIVSDSVFSMDGDIAPLKELKDLAVKYEAMMIIDDAHGTGVLGVGGGGLAALQGVSGIDVQIGTLSKALGGLGGFITGNRSIIEYLINRARSLIFTTALPPSMISSSITAIKLLKQEPKWQRQLHENIVYLKASLKERGFTVSGDSTPIIPIILKDSKKAVEVSQDLLDSGFLVPAIRPPAVPPGGARLRVTISAQHCKSQIDQFVGALATTANER